MLIAVAVLIGVVARVVRAVLATGGVGAESLDLDLELKVDAEG
jgi:hypothetical protein